MVGAERCREQIRRWFDAALQVVDPRKAVAREISCHDGHFRVGDQSVPLPSEGRLIVIAVGKAASAMASGAVDALGDRIDQGIILTKHGHLNGSVPGFHAYEAGHPVPDDHGLLATQRVLDAISYLAADDVVVCLISGGGSALLELPRDAIPLSEMRQVTDRLMRAGAGIHDLNAVRTALSQVKGGGLRRAIDPARCVSLLLSDVLGNDPSVIASGPTIISRTSGADARGVVDRFRVRDDLPSSVLSALDAEDDAREMPNTDRDIVSMIADNALLVEELARVAEVDGCRVLRQTTPFEGDAHDLARDLVSTLRDLPEDIDAIVRGGEATVKVIGDGIGGRNTEMALVAALELQHEDDWIVASLASDGDDGNSGAAGAIADPGTAKRSRDAGIDPDLALRENNSAEVFGVAGGLVVTGPTGTNVNDVYVAMRCRPSHSEK